MMTAPFVIADKRWHEHAQRWVAPGALFDPKRFRVDVVEERVARPWIIGQHYSGSYPAARLACGLFLDARLVGAAVFSVPMNQRSIPSYTGAEASAGVELGRFVCAPDVAYNGETWFLARAFALLRQEKPDVRFVLSYADPVERVDGDGAVVKPAHWGTIYQASNAKHVGRSWARRLLLAPNGAVVSDRALSKLRAEERGWAYCYRQLVAAGAPERAPHEELSMWVARALTAPGFRRAHHPGNLAYVFGLDAAAKRQLDTRHGCGLEYPRRAA